MLTDDPFEHPTDFLNRFSRAHVIVLCLQLDTLSFQDLEAERQQCQLAIEVHGSSPVFRHHPRSTDLQSAVVASDIEKLCRADNTL
jgi:hypothetical protein